MKAVQSYLDTSLKEIDDNEIDDPVYEYALPSEKMQAIQEAQDIDTGVDTPTKEEILAQQMSDLKMVRR
jgi:hypothetical protein